MELTFLNTDLEKIYVVDDYQSLIWTERYYKSGDFQLYTAVSDIMLELLSLFQESMNDKKDLFVRVDVSDVVMILENSEIETDIVTGNHIRFKGRSLSSMLDRRIVWDQTVLNGTIENCIEKLLNDAVINPKNTSRRMENFVFVKSTDTRLSEIKINTQYTGDNLLDAIVELCSSNNVGFRMYLNDQNKFCFTLYMGEDRSHEQSKNQEVIFSPEFDNLTDTKYYESIESFKNIALVAGEDQAQNRKTITIGDASGYQRRELYVDARDLQTVKEDGTSISDTDYNAQLKQRGEEKLSENKYVKVFEGGIESNINFIYGKDFFKGDIVQLSNEYNINGKVRILETIRSQDQTGYMVYPTFEVVT